MSNKKATIQALVAHKTALLWFLFIAVLGCWIYFAHYKVTNSIIIDQKGLDTAQYEQLLQVGVSFDNPSFYLTDLAMVADAFSQVPWVQSVQVARKFGQGVVVNVVPRTAVANFGSEHLLDVTGTLFVPADPNELSNPKLVNLYGRGQQQTVMIQVHTLNRWFAPLGLSVQDVILTPRQTWLVRFDNGLRLTVDHERAQNKLYVLSQLLQNERLPVPLAEIAVIDLRYKNGFSLTKKT